MAIKQQQQPQGAPQQKAFYMSTQDPLKLFDPPPPPPPPPPPTPPQLSTVDKKVKYGDVKMQDFYWEPTYRMGEGLPLMGDRGKRPPPGGICPEQDASPGPRSQPFEVRSLCPVSFR